MGRWWSVEVGSCGMSRYYSVCVINTAEKELLDMVIREIIESIGKNKIIDTDTTSQDL
jgi:hypothetical protein